MSNQSQLETLRFENDRLKRAVDELSILNDLAREIGGSRDSKEIIQSVVRRSLRAVNAEQGVVTLVESTTGVPMKTLVRSMATSAQQKRYHFNHALLGWMQINKQPLLLNEPRHDERFKGVQWDESITSLVCVPLMAKSELLGVLTVYNKRKGTAFTEEDQRLLAIIAAQSAQVLENARLYEEERELMTMREEVKLAAKIQTVLLPKSNPQVPGYDIAGITIPARSIGGDYYDFIEMDEQRLVLCLGDVTGKGLPASLLMANLQATIRGQTHSEISAKECIRRANRLLYQSTDIEKFVTLFYGTLDFSKHQLCYCNAGHNDPMLFSKTTSPRVLRTGGLILGIMDEAAYEQEVLSLRSNDVLVVYSDGITEAMDSMEQEYGEKRLQRVVQENHQNSAAELIEKIVASVREFAGATEQSDDMTIMVVKRNG